MASRVSSRSGASRVAVMPMYPIRPSSATGTPSSSDHTELWSGVHEVRAVQAGLMPA